MRFSLTYFVSLFDTRRLTPAACLHIAWWVIVGLSALALAADETLFLLFGADTAVPPPTEVSVPLGLDEETVRRAASLLEERRKRFEAPAGASDLANPFR